MATTLLYHFLLTCSFFPYAVNKTFKKVNKNVVFKNDFIN